MTIQLIGSAGPLVGRRFTFDDHDTFLLDRTKVAHAQVGEKEKYVSNIQFLVEVNPPRCRLVDMGNPSGTFVNGKRVAAVELHHFDEIKAGHTYLRVEIPKTGVDDATPLPRPRMPEIPGYRIESELGHGPLGAVYHAVREEDHAHVAIKTIVPSFAPNHEQEMSFLKDVTGVWDLEHPHIVSLHEVGAEDGVFWFAMDQVSGTTLAQLLKERGKLDETTAVRIVLQVLSALEHAHSLGIGHSDLKLSNVFLEEKDRKRIVKVADFGIARAYAATSMSGLSLTDHVDPAVNSIAPEQIANFRAVTASADQFAAAAILYQLLTDKSPYNLVTGAHPLGQVLNGAVVSIRQRRHGLSQDLATVVETALAREPTDRYPDVQTFAEALRPFAN